MMLHPIQANLRVWHSITDLCSLIISIPNCDKREWTDTFKHLVNIITAHWKYDCDIQVKFGHFTDQSMAYVANSKVHWFFQASRKGHGQHPKL